MTKKEFTVLIDEYNQIVNELKTLTELERFMRQFPAQIDYLKKAIGEGFNENDYIWELGHGWGRTLEFIESRCSNPIIVFEKENRIKLRSKSKKTKLVYGDLFQIIPVIIEKFVGEVKLVHIDIGTLNYIDDIENYSALSSLLEPVLMKNGFVISDRPIHMSDNFEMIDNNHDKQWPAYIWKKIS